MRSLVVISALSIALIVPVTACSGGSSVTGTGAPATTSDAGTGTTKLPASTITGGAVGKSAARPTKDAGSEVLPDPTPGTVPTCKGAALCVNDCADGDNTCYEACMKGMPVDEAAKFQAVGDCINQSLCETDDCVQTTCASEIRACIGD